MTETSAGATSTQTLPVMFSGLKSTLFPLALKTSILTVLTLGFYRFWMKTRLRRYYWSAIKPGDFPLEYTGTGVEKLLGFLVAVVVMAFYIGVFNLILMFLSFSLLNDNFMAYLASFAGVVPIYFFAQYRARRYVLARTRWRGIRFGIKPAAWRYAGAALLHWTLTILTLGILLPRQVFKLEKFRIDRTWFGDRVFTQGGKWTDLLRPATHFYIGLIATLATAGLGFLDIGWLGLLVVSIPWLIFGFIYFSVRSFAVMAASKRLGDDVAFQANPRTGRVIGIYLLGNLLTGLSMWGIGIVVVIVLVILSAMFGSFALDETTLDRALSGQLKGLEIALYAAIASVYFGFFALYGAFSKVFVTLPTMQHYAETLTIQGTHNLTAIRQRPRDEFSEAEGFAEALDIGAAI